MCVCVFAQKRSVFGQLNQIYSLSTFLPLSIYLSLSFHLYFSVSFKNYISFSFSADCWSETQFKNAAIFLFFGTKWCFLIRRNNLKKLFSRLSIQGSGYRFITKLFYFKNLFYHMDEHDDSLLTLLLGPMDFLSKNSAHILSLSLPLFISLSFSFSASLYISFFLSSTSTLHFRFLSLSLLLVPSFFQAARDRRSRRLFTSFVKAKNSFTHS